jgi:hypothetical protein
MALRSLGTGRRVRSWEPPAEDGKKKVLIMKRLYHMFTAVLVLFNLAVSNPCQSQQTDVEARNRGLSNLPSSPIRLSVSNSARYLEVSNHSSGTVIGYQLGCVVDESGKIKVKSRFATVTLKDVLKPADPFDKREWFVATDLSFRDLCQEKGDKLAVLSVSFADGGEWRLHRD